MQDEVYRAAARGSVNVPAPLTRVELNWDPFRFRTGTPLVAVGPFAARPPKRRWTVADHAVSAR